MGKVGNGQWAMWANEHALASASLLVLGGALAVAGRYDRWGIGIYAIVVGAVIFLVEYPRGKRKSGNTLERRFQKPFSSIISKGRVVTRNYFVRFVVYIVSCVPCVFILQTLLGAMCLATASLIYLFAALKQEEWSPIESVEAKPGPRDIAVPTRPPPRRQDMAPVSSVSNNQL